MYLLTSPTVAYQTLEWDPDHITTAGDYLACATFTHLPHHKFINAGLFYDTITYDAAGDSIRISSGIPLDPAVLYEEELKEELKWAELEFRGNEGRTRQVLNLRHPLIDKS